VEVAGLLAALREGRIDGSKYEGECSCLKGTIATVRGCGYRELGGGALAPDSQSPSELLFAAIAPGGTPAINPVAAIVEGWIVEWMREHGQVTP
jgi:hypothetical protein